MEIWHMWTTLIQNSVLFLSSQVGMSEAISIIAFTLAMRVALLPVSFKSTYNIYKNKLAINKLKPEIERLKIKYAENPGELTNHIMSLYKKHGIKFMDKTSLLNLGSQGILGLGVFQALKEMAFNSKFLWIANIAKPDVILAIFVGILTFLSMVMMPGASEQSTWIIFAIPALISIIVLASFPSAIGIFWATSNLVTVAQTLLLRYTTSTSNCPGNKI